MNNAELFFKLDKFFATGMSAFQINHFVIDDFITPYRKIRQAVTEVKARLENKALLELDIEELELKVQKHGTTAKESTDYYKKAKAEIRRKRAEYQLDRKRSVLVQMDYEISVFTEKLMAVVVQDFGDIDSLVDTLSKPEYHIAQEAEFWTKKLANSAFSDLMNYGVITKGVIESIVCLPAEQQSAILNGALEKHLIKSNQLKSVRDERLVALDK